MADRPNHLFVAPGAAPGGLVVFVVIGGVVWYEGAVPDLNEETLDARLTQWGAIGRQALKLSSGLDRPLALVLFDGDTGRQFAEIAVPTQLPPRWFDGVGRTG